MGHGHEKIQYPTLSGRHVCVCVQFFRDINSVVDRGLKMSNADERMSPLVEFMYLVFIACQVELS